MLHSGAKFEFLRKFQISALVCDLYVAIIVCRCGDKIHVPAWILFFLVVLNFLRFLHKIIYKILG